MLKLLISPRSLLVNGARGALLAASALVLAASCTAEGPDTDPEDTASEDSALERADAISRAEQWVSAKLQYCQAPNHARDYDDACSTYCDRTDNPQWDPYRSDCSGLVSWAWGLPAPGRTTWMFAPFKTDITHAIQASSLQPGDAVNNDDHIMLFKAWVTPGSRATFIEEPGCSTSITHAHEFTSNVSVSGTSIHVAYDGMTFTAIRYDKWGPGGGSSGGSTCAYGGLYCGGDKVSGDSSTLYRCNGEAAPTVVEHCAHGCSVNPGQDDSCKTSGGSTSSCVVGGLYCGGDKLTGDKNTLYRCNGASAPTVVQHCAAGCSVNSGSDDACKPSGGSCVVGGLYCGGDKVTGDPNTLYRCNGSGAPTVVEHCASGCSVNSGSDDSCKASGGTCVPGGLYCGGDKVSGDPSTLYKCNGSGAPTVVAHCPAGCAVSAGSDDSCKPSGGTCVVGGLYCGGDKVSGDPSTLYKCNGPGAPTVVKHCTNGCAVLPGQNDACK